jgi:hypothetical protein
MIVNGRKMTEKEAIEGFIAANDIVGVLVNWGWKVLESPSKKKRRVSCWVSPEGKWYNVPFSHHNIFALYVCKELFPKENLGCLEDGGPSILLKNGWISVYHDVYTGTVLRGYQRMNAKQYKELLSFFGDERLFRGWTIRAMWLAKEDMKEQSKDD